MVWVQLVAVQLKRHAHGVEHRVQALSVGAELGREDVDVLLGSTPLPRITLQVGVEHGLAASTCSAVGALVDQLDQHVGQRLVARGLQQRQRGQRRDVGAAGGVARSCTRSCRRRR
jgi:hypothetical protein